MPRKPKVNVVGDLQPYHEALIASKSPKPSPIRGGFLRVRGSAVGDPLHEFDIPVSLFERHPDRFTVVDPVVVAASRPMKAVAGVNVPDLTNDAPSEGELKEGN